ncbi:hypothetical protein EUA93_04685 [Nocardioides oleivorans]|uniref:Uncharacterized protein n=1 Tax=Nocardioides oleivorans TaxID=273676 RepID=A0A4Q2S097_9ACTN|nr:hypothetical protein [Nocardioides oleivorans]RYB93714.1 hypothetical protein EUA93_04685 [Nocardioides oleivorans]
MRFLGALIIELADGTTRTFKDRTKGRYDEANDETQWWTHTFEKDWDESLIVVRHVASVASWQAEDDAFTRHRGSHSNSEYTVARYQVGEWRRATRKLPK